MFSVFVWCLDSIAIRFLVYKWFCCDFSLGFEIVAILFNMLVRCRGVLTIAVYRLVCLFAVG